MKIYTYGVIDFNGRIDESHRGLNGALIYNIPYRDIGMVVSNLHNHTEYMTKVPFSEHNNVVERFMKIFPILPIRFRTLLNREDAISLMKNHYSDLRENFDRLRNKVEFGIKIIWQGGEVRKQIIRDYSKDNRRVSEDSVSQEKRFIEDVFEKYVIEKNFKERADICITIVDSYLSRFASEKRLEKLKSNNLLLNAFYLVEKGKQRDFKEAFKTLENAPGDFNYLLLGPLPPYNFVKMEEPSADETSYPIIETSKQPTSGVSEQ